MQAGNPHCLLSAVALGLVNGKQPFRINVFQTRCLNAVSLIMPMCLCTYAGRWVPQGTQPHAPQRGAIPREAASFPPVCGHSGTSPEGLG